MDMQAITKSGSFAVDLPCPCAPDGKSSQQFPNLDFYATQVDPQYPSLMKVAATLENIFDNEMPIPAGMHEEIMYQLNTELAPYHTTEKLLEIIIKKKDESTIH